MGHGNGKACPKTNAWSLVDHVVDPVAPNSPRRADCGPAVNLASLLVIARYNHWKVALLVAEAVWATAVAGGLLIG
jgi:hypothetical protein